LQLLSLVAIDAKWMAVARGDRPAEVVLKGGHVFSVFTREWLDLDLAIQDGHVVGLGRYDGESVIEVEGAYLVPGFIDGHVHIESSKLLPDELARALVPRGTTAIVADPHEIANVLGVSGVRWLLGASDGLPLEVFVMAPSSVPASPFESPRETVTAAQIGELLRHPRVLGVAEMMNYPGVIAGEPEELAKLAQSDHVDGHAPRVSGGALNAYIAAGIRSDHEATTYEEALEKRRLGMWVMLREASIARNLVDLLPLVQRYGPERCLLCTDDREPNFIVEEGHLDQMLRKAVAGGVAAEDALVMATLNAAEYHRLWRLGALAPGYQADVVVLEDLIDFRVRQVLKRGAEPVYPAVAVPDWVLSTVHPAPVSRSSFRVPAVSGPIRVIGVVPMQLLTTAELREPLVRDGETVADPGRDLVKIAVIERHHATGRIGLGFATNVGLRRGAYASTVAHDAHNLVVMGVDDEDMAACVRRLVELGGGIVVAEGGEVVEELPLPVAGLMSDRPLGEVHRRMEALERRLQAMGVRGQAPFMTLSFLALSVIPELKITDLGLVDVSRFPLVPLEAG
jgi:adenine deaminase